MSNYLKRLPLGRVAVVAVLAGLLATAGAGPLLAGEKESEDDGAYLGVYMQELTKKVRAGLDLDVKSGVLISGVIDDGPAEEAGIEDGDVIVMFDGRAVDSPDDLRDLVDKHAPGDKVKIQLMRDGEKKTIEVTLGEGPEWLWSDWDWSDDRYYFGDLGRRLAHKGHELAWFLGGPTLGVHVTEMDDDLATYFDTDAESGVLVLEVNDDSVAEEAGVKSGDVIQKVGDEKVTSTSELRKAVREFEEGDEFDLQVLRKGKSQTLKATMDETGKPFRVQTRYSPRHRVRVAPRVLIEDGELKGELREEIDKLRKEIEELRQRLDEKDRG